MSTKSNFEENPLHNTQSSTQTWPYKFITITFTELKTQRPIALPLIAMNLTWFAKIAITTAFLGRLGELQLAGGALGFTFANVTGFSVLTGLSGAMEPICGQAYGAKNFKLLHKTLVMTTLLLLLTALPISFLWLNVDRILVRFGQQQDISIVAKKYLYYLLPDLFLTSLLCPLKNYLTSQNITLPIMLSSAIAVSLHLPLNILLSRSKGLEGVSVAFWITDLMVVVSLAVYMVVAEGRKGRGGWEDGGWWDQGFPDWVRLLKLAGPCCLTACLEWWCYEVLMLLTGRLPTAKREVGVLAIVLNFDYLLYSIMLSLATSVSVRVSNELGANQPGPAAKSATVSLVAGIFSGVVGGAAMAAASGGWGAVYTCNEGIRRGVKKTMLLMAVVELVNFPVAVCGGIVRGTARPWLGMYASLGGFYFLALPLGVVLAFTVRQGLFGLLTGFLAGMVVCLVLLLFFVFRIHWDKEAEKAQVLASCEENEEHKNTVL